MVDFQINEDSGFYTVGSYSARSSPGVVGINNITAPASVEVFVQAWTRDAAVGPLIKVSTSYTFFGEFAQNNVMRVFIRPIENAFGIDLQISFDVERFPSFNPSDISSTTIQRDFDIIAVEDAPSAMTLSNMDISEGDLPILVGQLSATDPDQHPALAYSLVYDPTGQFSINFDRLFATGGLDFEALQATGLYSLDASGRLLVDLDIRVTDPTGLFNDFTKTIRISDVAENLVTAGTADSDIIQGTALADSISGAAGDDFLFGRAGDDILIGGQGDDFLAGQAGDDILRGNGGEDIIKGGAGDDRILGGRFKDFLFGGEGDDRIFGGAGRDQIIDGGGFDRLFGGAGKDVFELVMDGTVDVIRDFQDGMDLIKLRGVSQFSDLSISNGTPGTVIIEYGSERLLVRDGIGTLAASDFTADDFIF